MGCLRRRRTCDNARKDLQRGTTSDGATQQCKPDRRVAVPFYQSDQAPNDFAPWNDAYAGAIREVYTQYAADLDIAALFAEALMNRTPWLLWDLPKGAPAGDADMVEAAEMLNGELEYRKGNYDAA